MTSLSSIYILLKEYIFYILFGFVLVLYCFVDPMEVDSCQYAEISREIAHKGFSLQFFDKGLDYLDKPPMLFWLSALSFKIFGIHNWAFKLPSILISLLGIYFFYKYILHYYTKEIAKTAILLLLSSMAYFHMTNDVRCDVMLMGFNCMAIYFLASWLRENKIKDLTICTICIGLGMMTKGMLALILPSIVFLYYILIKSNWKILFKWEYVFAILMLLLLLTPMTIGLYQQFDLHPEKVVNGNTGVSGLRFFYWTQSFGRITGESVWNNNAGFLYLAKALIWQLLPYTLLLMYSLYILIRQAIIKQTWIKDPLSVPIVILGYLMLATSKYQLPHYIYIVFPFIILFVAIVFSQQNYPKSILLSQLVFLSIMIISVIFVLFFSMHIAIKEYLIIILTLAGIGLAYYYYLYKEMNLIRFSAFVSLGLHMCIASIFYPQLLGYQRGKLLSDFIAEQKLDKNNIYYYRSNGMHSLDYTSDFDFISSDTLVSGHMYIIDNNQKEELDNTHDSYTLLHAIKCFGVSNLSGKFLDPKKREKVLSDYYLIQYL